MTIKSPDNQDDVTARSGSETSPLPMTDSDHERPSHKAKKPAALTPKTNWAWTVSYVHFDWMDRHTVSTYAQDYAHAK
ncbi:hypothetical protein U875_25370 [Pandoraea pnomenusa 3kgm]|nr:hypothetical protein X636_04435 [Pandoraea pnomenusa]AIM43923.1 hypothetical protein U875_25370 [Pandoraea pnomenusa 3kgm]